MMKHNCKLLLTNTVFVFFSIAVIFTSCIPAVSLTASWHDPNVQPARFEKILVLSIGKNLEKRKLGEDKIKAELQKDGFNAEAGLNIFSPDFSKAFDSAKVRMELLDKGFDGVLTLRVLSVEEHEHWVRTAGPYYPVYNYRGFYRYYDVYGWYLYSGYMATDVKVLLESNLYNIKTGELLWSGQSTAFSKNPTPQMAEQYARNIIADMINKKVIMQ